MRVLVGTSGYAYKEWKGRFYPAELPAAQMLRFYAERFRTVEINNTFYRMPREHVLTGWAKQVPLDFRFVLKASRRITHQQRLRDIADPLRYLLETTRVLGERLGATLFQLPPTMKKDVDRLRALLELLPGPWPTALEFRHDSWFDDDVFELLRLHDAALCVTDAEEGEVPITSTASFGYLRLRRPRYEEQELRIWRDRIVAQAWDRVFVFFKHEDEAAGTTMAHTFGSMLALRP